MTVLVAELVQKNVDIIVVGSSPNVGPASGATKSISNRAHCRVS